jgi:hypothetical protein
MNRHFHTAAFLALTFALILFGSTVLSATPTAVSAQTDSSERTFSIVGAVSKPLVVSMSDLVSMPKTVVNASLYCEGVLLRYGNWTGVTLSYLLDQAGADPGAANLDFHASDGYEVTLGLSEWLKQQIIGYSINGEPLGATQLVLPGWAGSYWIGMITEIDVIMPSVVVTPPVSQMPQPSMTPQPTATSTQTAPSSQPPLPTIQSTPTSTPMLPTPITETPTATPTASVTSTPAPATTGTPQPIQSSQPNQTNETTATAPNELPSQRQNQTAPSPESLGLGSPQDNPTSTPFASTWNYNFLLVGIAVAGIAVIGILILKRSRNIRVSK